MKRLCIFLVIFFLICYVLYSSDEINNWTFNFSPATINLLDFNEEKLSPAEEMSIASTMLSLSIGVGYHFNIIPYLFSPGIYLDFGIGYLSLFTGGDSEEDGNNRLGGLWAGLRLYNQFKVNSFKIQPFIGISLYGFSSLGVPATTYGILFAYKYYGIEYSFHLPFERDKIFHIHRISFTININ